MLRDGGDLEETGIVSLRALDKATYGHFAYKAPRYDLNARDILAMAARRATEAARRERAKKVAEAIKQARGLQPGFVAPPKPIGPAVADILRAVSDATGYSRAELCAPWRPLPLARARQLGYWLIRTLRPDLSYPSIGRAFGNRDHTTCMYGIEKFHKERDKPPLRDWLQHSSIKALK